MRLTLGLLRRARWPFVGAAAAALGVAAAVQEPLSRVNLLSTSGALA